MNIEEAIKFLEEISNTYKDDTPTRSINNRVFLERRWQAAKFVIFGLDKKNYKEALKEVEQLMNTESEKDEALLNKLVEVIQKYEKENYG